MKVSRLSRFIVFCFLRLGECLFDEFSVDVGKSELAALKAVGEAFVVDAEEMKDRCVKVVNVDGVFKDVVAIVVGFSDGDSFFDSCSSHPHAEALGMMITSVIFASQFSLTVGGSPKLTTPDEESILQHATLFEIGKESGGWMVGVAALAFEGLGEAAVMVPSLVEKLNEAHVTLGETTSEKAVGGV